MSTASKKKGKEHMETSNDIIIVGDSAEKTRERKEKEKYERDMKRLWKVCQSTDPSIYKKLRQIEQAEGTM